MIVGNFCKIVKVIDHGSIGLCQAIGRGVRTGVHRMNARTIAQMKPSYGIIGAAIGGLGFQQIIGCERGALIFDALGQIRLFQPAV